MFNHVRGLFILETYLFKRRVIKRRDECCELCL